MNYSKQELDQIEKLASVLVKISVIADILGIPSEVLRDDISDKDTEVSKVYRRAKAASMVKVYSQEMMLAQVGSPLAIDNVQKHLLDMEDDE